MLGLSVLLIVCASLGSFGAASDGVVQWHIERRQVRTLASRLAKRVATTFEEVIHNEKSRGGYFAKCSVGGQDVTLQLDTGSSDLWVPADSACESDQLPNGCSLGSFKKDQSSSFKVTGKDQFSIQYIDGSFARGDYFTDTFSIGGVKVSNLTMGLGKQTDIPYGLAGVGYALNEAIVGGNSSNFTTYPNLPATMLNDGLINTNAFSLWLNNLDASTGRILFGGVDVAKFKGVMSRIRIYEDAFSQEYKSFTVALTSLEAHSGSGQDTLTSRSFPIPVVLDSGTTLSYLPNDLAVQTWTEVGALYSAEYGQALLPCTMEDSKGYFVFGFAGPDGPKIQVEMKELVLDLTNGPAPKFTNGRYQGQDACTFGIQNFTGQTMVLGDTFLRSAYVVYDLVNHEIGIAQTDFNSTTSEIIAFPSSGAPIPSATVAPNQDQAVVKPQVTIPAFNAQPGFRDGVSQATSSIKPLNKTHILLMGVAIALIMSG